MGDARTANGPGRTCSPEPGTDVPTRELDFEQRIGDLSRRFLTVDAKHPDRLQEAVRAGLEEAAAFAGAERAWLLSIDVDAPWLAERFEWRAPGLADLVGRVDDHHRRVFAWSARRIEAGEIFHAPSPASLPPEAAAERDDMLERGVKSSLGIPVRADGALIAFLCFESESRPRDWSPREITRLRVVAEIFASACRRLRSEVTLAREREHETRLAALSRELLTLGARHGDDAIRDALAEVAQLARADRVALFGFETADPDTWDSYEWCALPDVPPPSDPTPWSIRQVAEGRIIHLPTLDALPAEASAERANAEVRGVRSALGIPVHNHRGAIGLLALECMSEPRSWSDQEITLLRLAAEILTGALRRRRAERALRDSQAQLLQSQKMEAVGRLAGGVAHDFNNLLMVIGGHCEHLLKALDLGTSVHRDAEAIQHAAQRAASLTRRLLAFSRREPASREAVDLNAVVADLRTLLGRLLGADVELAVECSPAPVIVRADGHQLEQLLLNLALNARDAMADGGRLGISVECSVPAPEDVRRLQLAPRTAYGVLSVSDSGHGMDDATRSRIFEPFFTTKSPGEGTGLGLSIVYAVVRQHRGAIDVESGPRAGARFRVFLPLMRGPQAVREDPVATSARTARRCEAPGRGDAHVLLVEDEPAVRRLVRRMLEGAGYRVTEAADGGEALGLAETSGFDLLVSDVSMPRMGGPELAERLRARRPDLPVLFLSGYPRGPGAAGEVSIPKDTLLQKPFTGKELLARVQALLEVD